MVALCLINRGKGEGRTQIGNNHRTGASSSESVKTAPRGTFIPALFQFLTSQLWSIMYRAVVLLTLVSTSAALKPEWIPGDYPLSEAGAESFVSDYNSTAEQVFYFSTEASWNYNTNLTDHNSQLQVL